MTTPTRYKIGAPVFLLIASMFGIMYVYPFKATPITTGSLDLQASHHRGNLSLADKLIMLTAHASKKQMVLLVTEGRSGSSWTSELIYTNPSVFFVFEPLASLKDNVYQERKQIILSKTSLEVNGTMSNTSDAKRKSLAWVEAYLLCDPREPSLYSNSNFENRPSLSSFWKCFQNKTLGWSHVACYSRMVQECRDHDVVFIKTIRFRLEWTRSLLKNYPNLKVIFLVRDPRAVLYSRSKLSDFKGFKVTSSMSGLDERAASMCGDMQQNVDAFRRLDRQFPERLKALRFEDGALDPVGYTRDIYSFLGLNLTEDIQNHVLVITGQKGPEALGNQGAYGTSRADSKNQIQKWRDSRDDKLLYYPFAKKLDLKCKHVYDVLGYSRIKSKDDFLSNRSLVVPPLSMENNGIFKNT